MALIVKLCLNDSARNTGAKQKIRELQEEKKWCQEQKRKKTTKE
jgi:hypothetical protein